MAELHLTAQACAANVVVRDTVPANASYVRSEPAATVDGKQLTWQIGNLESGESRGHQALAEGRAGRHDRELCLRVR